jgi:transcriptional regulator with XRE-family HTH domain
MNDNSYINWQSMSDMALCKIVGEFIKHHRLQQNKTQSEVATDAGISRSTLSLLERGETVTTTTLFQVIRVLDLLNVMDVFNVQKKISPIKLAKLEQQQRQRAIGKKNIEYPKNDW